MTTSPEHYDSVWMDSMSTQIMTSGGAAQNGGAAIAFSGEMSCPVTNGPIKVRQVLTIGSDQHLFEDVSPGI